MHYHYDDDEMDNMGQIVGLQCCKTLHRSITRLHICLAFIIIITSVIIIIIVVVIIITISIIEVYWGVIS